MRGPVALIMAALLCAGGVVAAVNDHIPLSPGDVAEMVARESQAAVQAQADSITAAADVAGARAAWWPRLTAGALYTTRDHPQEIAAGPLVFPMGLRSNGQYELRAEQLVWDGGRRGLAVQVTRRRGEAIRAGGRASIQKNQLAALQDYVAALSLTASLHVFDQRLEALQTHRQDVNNLYEAGLVARNDLLETEVRVHEVADARADIVEQRAVVVGDLNRLLGRDLEAELVLPDSLPPVPVIPEDVAELTARAAENNPAVVAAARAAEAAALGGRLARRAWAPAVVAAAGHAWQQNDALVHSHVNSLSVGLRWDVFDGGVRKADVRKADARRLAAERAGLEARRSARQGVDQTWRVRRQARREEKTARANVAAAVENLRIVEDQYQQGTARSSDVLDAEALLAASRFALVTKHHDVFLATARLAAAAGYDLVDVFAGVTMNSEDHHE